MDNSRNPEGGVAAAPPAVAHDERSLGELVKELRDEVATLFREEVALARTEVSEKASRVTRNVAYLIAGGFVALAGLIVLLNALSSALALALVEAGMEEHALWLGPLIVGAVVAAIGAGMAMKGKNALQKEPVTPEKTARSVQENKEWAMRRVT